MFPVVIAAIFSFAAWSDGEPWRSGFAAGAAVAMLGIAIRDYFELRT